jgi:uncharacterized protein YjiS (DUF1127 family)
MTHTVLTVAHLTVAHYLQKPISEFITLICNGAEYMKRRAIIRKSINELNALTDYELRDIGIYRCDIRSVVEGHRDMSMRTETNPNMKGFV